MTRSLTAPKVHVSVREPADVAMARKHARDLAAQEGLPEVATEALATAVSEIAQNIVDHAGAGDILIAALREKGRRGLLVIARDDGPGIADLAQAQKDGYSTSGTLGIGLSSARRFMDEFELVSAPGVGTTVTMKKWAP